ncbi:MAG: hypothetical protein D6690_18065 [Nitrospirae bacterium]|nr:MAG: hypothetical protein D6690_18065 [Nitrospirota bacterium]
MNKFLLRDRTEWRTWAIPRRLWEKPIHRWFVFPHSFSSELVYALADEWGLGSDDHILDPFAGAGTTILAAKELGIRATGYDLSPLAVLITRVKSSNYSAQRMEQVLSRLMNNVRRAQLNGTKKQYPELVSKALPGDLLGAFDSIDRCITKASDSKAERDFIRLALLATLPKFSRAVATGGWLKWVTNCNGASSVVSVFERQVRLMIEDLRVVRFPRRTLCKVGAADARVLPDAGPSYSAVITSPPYPNRHDYTRVFGVELMFGFLDWEGTRQLRYQSFHSHPEARPNRPEADGYRAPRRLTRVVSQVRKKTTNRRVHNMLEGYFLDMYLTLREIKRVCQPGAKIAFVVGNVQYNGEQIPVDYLTAEVGEQAGLSCQEIAVARYRGNSAQQMGRFGRIPSRESVVIFKRPGSSP